MHEDHRDITVDIIVSVFLPSDKLTDLLDALSSIDKVRELIDSKSLKAVLPFIIDKYQVKKPETLFRHVEEPHAHCAKPHH